MADIFDELTDNALNFNGFKGTEFPYPLLYGITGRKAPSLKQIEQGLKRVKDKTGGFYLDALWLAELIESLSEDNTRFFVTDDKFRHACLRLNESINGWALLIGQATQQTTSQLIRRLHQKKLAVFCAGKIIERVKDSSEKTVTFGSSETGIIYFAQMLVRYALIYGRADAGDSHEISHNIEEHAPGVIVVGGKLSDTEKILLQGMLSLGTPTVTLHDGHDLVGTVKVSTTISGLITNVWRLPNIRARLIEKATPAVPVPVSQLFAREEIKNNIEWMVSGSPLSFIAVQPSPEVTEDAINLLGNPEKPSDFSVLVELGNRKVDAPVTTWMETMLRRVINYAKGVKVKIKGNKIVSLIVTKEAINAGFTIEHLGNLIKTELRNEFPAIGPIWVTFILRENAVRKAYPAVQAFIEARAKMIASATEETERCFYGCTRCRSFSLAHACTVTPDRPAQCGTPWYHLKAQVILAPDSVYDPCVLIEKGKLIDSLRGEYAGVNRSTETRTEGRVKRVFLHSIFDFPHTACSCFRMIAFHIPAVDGIGLMHRGFSGIAPNSMTWTKLANKVAGRQCKEGVASFGIKYLHSPKFLQGDGGYSRVVWMTDVLKKTAGAAIPARLRETIATEKDATTVEELKIFLNKG